MNRSYQYVLKLYQQAERRLTALIIQHLNPYEDDLKEIMDYIKNEDESRFKIMTWNSNRVTDVTIRNKIMKRIKVCNELYHELGYAEIVCEDECPSYHLSHYPGWSEDGMYDGFDDWEQYRDANGLD